ncbi:tyrosine-protein phosphatase [Gulosibacter sp. ACHW.36C]|uniref:Tyrosine-protein phosphatase n=1 Tax=Gulosibacter sediminis TaxID=1729695 RepID=A0ABY4MYU8_9MICO|nr:tyrosine-protein phosphatase [Gulosibacter sediminis]UQN15252.1 tyrosine-protein phosphatase [Gulosibacter sediminis]
MARERDWPGAFNARDLGGIPVAAGVLAPGVLFRSGQPQTWGPDAWVRAEAEGVRRVLDLRDPSEPRGSATGTDGIDYRFTPVEDPELPAFRARFDPYLNHPSGYPDFVGLFAERVAVAVGEVLEAGPGTLVCCSAGRDRTGLVTGILLLRYGADAEVLAHEDELAVRAVNEHHLHRAKPHPYERWHDETELAEIIRSCGDAVREFAEGFDAHEFLRTHGVADAAVERARDWLIASR